MRKYYIVYSTLNDSEPNPETGIYEIVERPIYYVYDAKTNGPVTQFQFLWQAQNYCEINDPQNEYN